MKSDHRILARLRAENMALRALIVELGGTPPVPPAGEDTRPGPSPRLPMLAHLARRGL
ncbi:hypothetical protein [Methylobacterium indicum]|uniref:hypothetical protein n=1 Tax=Methylobacterium indicum TaxID=1775910 RepID=UPI000A61A35F|nr:hypothetical protein [Methylobacterium indicum]